MKQFLTPVLLALLFALPPVVRGQILYLATGAGSSNAQLFTINPSTAAATYVADITVGGFHVSMTGLAFQPGTGVLYGVTSNGNNYSQTLVTINPLTGAATIVGGPGALSGVVSDITFNQTGTMLFGWAANIGSNPNRAVTINLITGVAGSFGTSDGSTNGGAIAIDPISGTAYVSHQGSGGALQTLDTSTGSLTTGATMSGGTFGFALAAMAIDNASVIYALNINGGGGSGLMTLDPTTGVLTAIGSLPNYSDAMAFSASAIPEPSTWAAIVGAAALGAAIIRRRKSTV
jgi:hypothetical protein